MLIKNNKLAEFRVGKQLIFGLAEAHEMYLFEGEFNEKEPAYVLCVTVDPITCEMSGIIEPWSKLLLDYKSRGAVASDIYKMFNKMKFNEIELVSIGECVYTITRLTEKDFIIIGATTMLYCVIEDDNIVCDGEGSTEIIEKLNVKRLLVS